MSDTKFTKGEWGAFYPHEMELNRGYVSVETEEGVLIYGGEIYKSTLEERVANARLIAAAPELYSELEFIKGYLQGNRAIEFKNRIDKLLAKARGETQD